MINTGIRATCSSVLVLDDAVRALPSTGHAGTETACNAQQQPHEADDADAFGRTRNRRMEPVPVDTGSDAAGVLSGSVKAVNAGRRRIFP